MAESEPRYGTLIKIDISFFPRARMAELVHFILIYVILFWKGEIIIIFE